jgi:hypothetical protein
LLSDSFGNPVGFLSTAANVSEQKQVLPLLQKVVGFVKALLRRGIIPILEADKGYDCRALRVKILEKKVFPMIPYRGISKLCGVNYLDKMRWHVERSISWLQRKFRRVNLRWERKMVYWKGFLQWALIKFWMGKIRNYLGLCG